MPDNKEIIGPQIWNSEIEMYSRVVGLYRETEECTDRAGAQPSGRPILTLRLCDLLCDLDQDTDLPKIPSLHI